MDGHSGPRAEGAFSSSRVALSGAVPRPKSGVSGNVDKEPVGLMQNHLLASSTRVLTVQQEVIKLL